MLRLDFHKRLGHIRVLEPEEGEVDRNHHVDAFIGKHRFQRATVVFKRSRSNHVDGVLYRSGGRQEAAQRFFRRFGKLGHLHAVVDDAVGGHDAGTTRIGDDAYAVALGNRAVGKDLGCGKELL